MSTSIINGSEGLDKRYLARCLRSLKEWGAPLEGWYFLEVIDMREDDEDAELWTCELCGCDILLIPTDLNGSDAARYYDEYITGIVELVGEGAIPMERIDESVRRILTLKDRRGILEMDVSGADV